MPDAIKILEKNQAAVIVLVAGSVVVAFVFGNRVLNTAEGTVNTVETIVRDLSRKIISSGFISAVILVGSLLLGAPAWIAFAATGLYLGVSAAGKAFGALAASATGTGTGALDSSELVGLLCESHGGLQSELTAGGLVIVSCRDGQSFTLRG